jgi:pimeloyl-ACP methyl ester carboxylesterase
VTLNWTQSDIVVNKARLHYYRTGDSKRDPLVLVHGFSDNGLCWPLLARDLESAYDVILPDARGHGLSARVQRGQEIDLAADLAGIIRGLGLARPIVAGHSMGASTAALLGARFPDMPGALILEDPAWRPAEPTVDGEPANWEDSPLGQWIRSLADLSLEQIVDQNRVEHPTWPDVILRRWCAAKQQLDLNFLAIRFGGQMDWQKVARSISCPTLLITAEPEKGGIVTPQVARMATEMNEHIRVAHIPGTGHHIRFENYDAYVGAVKTFLKQIGP